MTDALPKSTLQMSSRNRPETALSTTSRNDSIYVMGMLFCVAMLHQADNFAFSILLDPIQKDLGVSNTTMGLLAGAAYSLVFAITGIPLARLADIGNRKNLIAAVLAIWSTATALCGAAGNVVQLFAARVGVAAAESAFQPSAMSMVGDLFAPARRGIAVAVIMMGGATGIALGAIVAGAVAEAYNWRIAFVVLGFPGLLVAVLFWRTVPEPIRGARDGGNSSDAETSTTLRAFRYLASVPTAWKLILGNTMLLFAHAGWRIWLPAFFLRVHDMSMVEMSATFGALMGASAVLSMLISGFVSDWLAKKGERRRIIFLGASLMLGIPFAVVAILINDVWLAWTLIVIFNLITGGAAPVVAAAGLSAVRPRARALWSSISNFAGYGIGGLCGPVAIGFLYDHFVQQFGDQALRYSLLAVPAIMVPAALTYLWASASANRDAEKVSKLLIS